MRRFATLAMMFALVVAACSSQVETGESATPESGESSTTDAANDGSSNSAATSEAAPEEERDDSADQASPTSSTSPPGAAAILPCWADEPSNSPITSAESVTVGSGFEGVIARANYDDRVVASDTLVYEANNTDMRGARVGDRYEVTGSEVAARWRDTAATVDKLLVLRDSLFSQPDHPFLQPNVCALMLAPNWITVAAHHPDPIAPTTPDLEDDAAWIALADSPTSVFGSFPPSSRMHELATSPLDGPEGALSRQARTNLITLASFAEALLTRRAEGTGAVLEQGASIISDGDLRYFGAELRRDSFIPILVANPGEAELAEGKGAAVAGLDVAEADLDALMVSILQRRLLDGDVAIERYDLSTERDQLRAIAILEALIPAAEADGPTVWLWVNGRLDPEQKLRGEGPIDYMDEFSARLDDADVAQSRLRYVAKPVVDLPASGARAVLEEAIRDSEAVGLPVSITLDSLGLQAVLNG